MKDEVLRDMTEKKIIEFIKRNKFENLDFFIEETIDDIQKESPLETFNFTKTDENRVLISGA